LRDGRVNSVRTGGHSSHSFTVIHKHHISIVTERKLVVVKCKFSLNPGHTPCISICDDRDAIFQSNTAVVILGLIVLNVVIPDFDNDGLHASWASFSNIDQTHQLDHFIAINNGIVVKKVILVPTKLDIVSAVEALLGSRCRCSIATAAHI
jgi:hypothetical protein